MADVRAVYQPVDEVEARAIEAVLSEEGILFSLRPRKDTAYPGVVDLGGPWGDILVREEDEERARALISDWLAAPGSEPALAPYRKAPEPTAESEEAHRKPGTALRRVVKKTLGYVVLAGVVGASLVLNVVLLSRSYRSGPSGKIFDRDGRLLEERHLRVGQAHPWLVVRYAKGQAISMLVDRDADGRQDRRHELHAEGLQRTHMDEDDDGIVDRVVTRQHGKTLHVLRDTDGDRLLDELVLASDRPAGPVKARDVDGDGFPERFECAPKAVFDARSCAWLEE